MGQHAEFDLEQPLIDFAVRVINLSQALPNNRAGNHTGNQILLSGSSPAANYAEAQSAEPRSDFLHKLKLSLKKLRETLVWLRMIARADLVKPASKLEPLGQENEELISIFVASVKTATANRQQESKGKNS